MKTDVHAERAERTEDQARRTQWSRSVDDCPSQAPVEPVGEPMPNRDPDEPVGEPMPNSDPVEPVDEPMSSNGAFVPG